MVFQKGKFAFGILALIAMVGQADFAAGEETLEEKADLWGRMHGAAIYCRLDSAHEFGISVVRYFQRRIGNGAQLDSLKQIYGINLIEYAHKPPTGEVGRGCGPFNKNYNSVFTMLRG